MIWHFGNTTVRSPFRLREGLIALAGSPLEGNLRGESNERAFCRLLSEHGIVDTGNDSSYSVGRKWRSALAKLGLLYPKLPEAQQNELGRCDTITENGRRLITSESVSGWQECFLRSLVAYRIPSVIEKRYECNVFSPLRYVLALLSGLEERMGESRISFIEMSLLIQTTSFEKPTEELIENIFAFREQRSVSENKRLFDRDALQERARSLNKKPSTLGDYADTNFRYLKATGLVLSRGRGISLNPEKRLLVNRLIQDTTSYESDLDYLETICAGALLPTDQHDGALSVLMDLTEQLERRGEIFDLEGRNLQTPADIAIVRHEIEDRIGQLNELDYATQQAQQTEEICCYMDLLISRGRPITLDNGTVIEIPRAEYPAYFEWITWRAFLAINSLVNAPWEARRFKIDQDFLPIGTAPGNGPDMVFEFEDMLLVVEVTLTSSSRQEAAEGEPVRRHVAKYAEDYAGTGKQVFGLFLAVNIDTNTANTFRLGEWYLRDDRRIDLHIVPMAVSEFKNIIATAGNNISTVKHKLQDLLIKCRMHSNMTAPEWKQKVSEITLEVSSSLTD